MEQLLYIQSIPFSETRGYKLSSASSIVSLYAYNETIEEALESLYPLVSEKGMDWMYSNCSTTAQRGALDWAPKFKEVLKPVINDCYEKVVSGEEASSPLTTFS